MFFVFNPTFESCACFGDENEFRLRPFVFQVCEMKNCMKCIFFEMRKKKDLYMWVSNVPSGPSAKFLVENGMLT